MYYIIFDNLKKNYYLKKIFFKIIISGLRKDNLLNLTLILFNCWFDYAFAHNFSELFDVLEFVYNIIRLI